MKRDDDISHNSVLLFRVHTLPVSCFVIWYVYILTNYLRGWGRYRVRVMETPATGSSVKQLKTNYQVDTMSS